jgi:hypothetical protein
MIDVKSNNKMYSVDFNEGDEVYMIDCVCRRCKIHKAFDGNLSLIPLDAEWENKGIRAISKHDEAIELLKEKLNEMKKGE